jgi:NAD(P)-dependent dehydrogenase (short-subunit alcohol dehydrogenase family)
MQLAGKRIIVTGAANGIGAATVRAYAGEGARVSALDVADERGHEVAAEAGPQVAYHHCDVARRDEVFAVFERAAAELGGLDVLAHAAGIERGTPAEDITEDEWDLVLDVNLKGTVYTNQAAFRHLRAHGGRIINFGSGAGVRGQRGSAHYSAAKAGVMAWTRTVAQEWAQHGITVNSVLPAIWTGMYDAHRARMTPEELAIHDLTMRHVIPLGGRLGDAGGDLAPVMVFLAGDGGRFITGQAIAVDGGMVMLG